MMLRWEVMEDGFLLFEMGFVMYVADREVMTVCMINTITKQAA